MIAPGRIALYPIGKARERGVRPAAGEDIGAIGHRLRRIVDPHCLEQRQQRMARGARVLDAGQRCHRAGGEFLAVDIVGVFPITGQIPQRLAVFGQERVDIDQRIDARSDPRRHSGDHHPAIAVPGQHEAIEPGGGDLRQHILDMRGQRDSGMKFACARAKAGKLRHDHPVPRGNQAIAQGIVAPATAPGAVDQDIVGHPWRRS